MKKTKYPILTSRDLKGVYTALITPFRNNIFDAQRFRKQIAVQIAAGVTGIVPCGTTGESPTLSVEEHMAVIGEAVKAAADRIQVIAGTGANSTDEAIYLTQAAKALGADASLQVVPYYNKPTQVGLYEHFTAVAHSTRLPIVLYNIPSRTGTDLLPESIGRLCTECPTIIGVKEASGLCDRVTAIRLEACKAGREIAVLCGDDALTIPFMSLGAAGVISVLSNAYPAAVREMTEKSSAHGRMIYERYYRLIKLLFREGNPVGIKCLLALLGNDSGEVRLPLTEVSGALSMDIRDEVETMTKW